MLSRLKRVLENNSKSYYEHREKLLSHMNREIPTIMGSTYSTTEYNATAGVAAMAAGINLHDMAAPMAAMPPPYLRRISAGHLPHEDFAHANDMPETEVFLNNRIQQMATRLVRVLILDPNENLNLESRLIYAGKEQLTDLTDQELFFSLPMQELLQKHNDLRSKTVDKALSSRMGKEIFLEPVRISQLKMVVVNVAAF